MFLLKSIFGVKHLAFPCSPATRMRTSDHAFEHFADKNVFYFKNIFHSHSQPPKNSISIVRRVNLIHVSFEAAHSFLPFILVSITQLCVFHSGSQQERNGGKKAVTHLSWDHFTHKKQHRKTPSFTSSYF